MMNVRLLYPDDTVLPEAAPGKEEEDRFTDLNLEPILKAMGDREAAGICRRVLDAPAVSPEVICYRQEILREFLQKPAVLSRLRELCREAEERRQNTWYRMTSPHLSTVYSSAADLLAIYMETLVAIRKFLEQETFSSRGLGQLSALLSRELSEEYLDQVRALRGGIADQEGILISAGFGPYLQGVAYVKRKPEKGFSRLRWMTAPTFTLADRDMNGAKDLEVRRDRAINEVANAMAQAAASLQSFTDQLRTELSFYAGALSLHSRMTALGLPVCFPVFGDSREFTDLRELGLALESGGQVVGSDLLAERKGLILITGANQGGKTTFLRSLGQCQLMAQCGLFVCARRCALPVRTAILTHFGREEDRKMDSGKLDEELQRMSRIVDRLRPGGMLLCNESFSSTNDRDGSQIFLGITGALLEKGIEVVSVTHLIHYAQALADREDACCLLAQRTETGERTFRLLPGRPLSGAYAEDLYREIFPPAEGCTSGA